MLIAFIVGHVMLYEQRSIVLILLPLIFLLVFPFVPETPSFQMKRGAIAEARNAMRFYRNASKSVTESELEAMCQTDESAGESNDNAPIMWQEFSKFHSLAFLDAMTYRKCYQPAETRHGRRATFLAIGLICGAQLSGCFVMLNYTASIFQASGVQMDANMAAILMGIIQLLGAYMSSIFVDRLGRKVC